ncbi:MAG: hypothetical protein ACTHJS_18525 [Xanthobacteraceae bacterium]
MALGKRDLSSLAFNRGAQELTNVVIIEEARGFSQLAGDRDEFLRA